MSKTKKFIISLLVVMNAVVLLGQILPEGAPPFAVTVNIIFLCLNIVFLLYQFVDKKSKKESPVKDSI